MNDLELLRRYEPVVRYTEGELFFPCAVEEYVNQCSLLVRSDGRGRPATTLVPAGELTVEMLAAMDAADPSRALCLRFVAEPLKGRALLDWQRRPDRPSFSAAGRLARVGLGPRFIDSLFQLSLLLRGAVPGGTTAGAQCQYVEMQDRQPQRVYYGRVVREGGYIVLNYHFFFVMNDWRSTFHGVNDHESDWEQIFVYLTEEPDGPPQPAWVAFASHDYSGDDLRRRWDDPEVRKEGTHPVVFAGAGSHASYFSPGEYLTSVPIQALTPAVGVVRTLRRIWRDVLRQGQGEELVQGARALISVPFVDYARGDGRAIGPGQPEEWSPVLLTEDLGWVEEYRGLWGLDTRDPLSGEVAPSGPKYQRDGSIRQSWYDPLGWSGLEKVTPPPRQTAVLAARIAELETEIAETDGELSSMEAALARQDLELRSLSGVRYLDRLQKGREQEIQEQEKERNALRHRRSDLAETLAACRRRLQQIEAGDPGDPRSHIHHAHEPESPQEIRSSRIAEVWAGLSIGILLLGGVLIMLFDADNPITALVLFLTAIIVVESILHRSLVRLLINVTIVLALLCTLVLVYEFFWYLTLIAVVVIAVIILWDNIRELRRT